MNEENEDVNILSALFDTSFDTFVTNKLIQVVYIILLVGIILGVGVMVLASFMNNGLWSGLLTLLFSPILFVLLVIVVRVALEFVIVVFRIADYVHTIAENSMQQE